MTRVKELADELGVTPQSIRNFAKKNFDFAKEKGPFEFTDEQCSIIAHHFSTGRRKKDLQTEDDGLQSKVIDLQMQVARLEERCRGLERENDLLRNRLERADEALEREQKKAIGFWANIGRRLLGSGNSE